MLHPSDTWFVSWHFRIRRLTRDTFRMPNKEWVDDNKRVLNLYLVSMYAIIHLVCGQFFRCPCRVTATTDERPGRPGTEWTRYDSSRRIKRQVPAAELKNPGPNLIHESRPHHLYTTTRPRHPKIADDDDARLIQPPACRAIPLRNPVGRKVHHVIVRGIHKFRFSDRTDGAIPRAGEGDLEAWHVVHPDGEGIPFFGRTTGEISTSFGPARDFD